jgi:hypothetical protein
MGAVFDVSETGLITTIDGIFFPSEGVVPQKLDCNGSITITFQMTGAVTPTFDFPVTFTKAGNIVVMRWDGFQKTRNSLDFLYTADLVPAIFLPSFPEGNPLVWEKTIIDGASLSNFSTGSLSFGPLGNIQIGRIDGANFTSTYCGILGSTITYSVD